LSRKKIEFLFSGLIVLFLLWIVWEARNWPAPSKFFPWSLGFTVLVLALVQLVVALCAVLQEIRLGVLVQRKEKLGPDAVNSGYDKRVDDEPKGSRAGTNPYASEPSVLAQDSAPRRAVTICGWIVAFFLGIWLVGFKFGSLFLTFAFMKFTANEKWMISASIAVRTYLFLWIVFDIALKVPLDNGFIAAYFGLN